MLLYTYARTRRKRRDTQTLQNLATRSIKAPRTSPHFNPFQVGHYLAYIQGTQTHTRVAV